MKKLAVIIAVLFAAYTSNSKTPPLYWGPLQNVTKTLPIILEPISVELEGAFWALLIIHEAVNVMVASLVPLENHDVGVWTYNTIEHDVISWIKKEYPTRDITLITSYLYNPQTLVATWTKRLQFTVIDQFTGKETTTVTWDTTPPLVNDFNKMKVVYTRLGINGVNQTTFKYDSSGSTMFYCFRRTGGGYPRPLRVTVYGLYWTPRFQNDYMKKTYIQDPAYSSSRWVLLGPDNMVVWSVPDPPEGLNVEFQSVGEATAFYQFPAL